MKTNINAEFVISGYEFNTELITNELNLVPNETWNRGDKVPNRNNTFRRDCCWSIESGCIESFDICEQIDILLDRIENKKEIFNKVKKRFDIEYLILITINIVNDEKPIISFKMPIIQFANDIGARIDVDYYIL